VTHHGEVPHLDVIVEDEQLSLAIGKRGQNVRLASELIGARIDIKSESDVKDEVADALARMLQDAMAESPLSESTHYDHDDEVDWDAAPGVGNRNAEALQDAGFSTYGQILDADMDALVAVEGIGPKTAQSLIDWVQERLTADADTYVASDSDEEYVYADDSDDDDSDVPDDFMEALSRALAESEEQRAAEAAAADDEYLDEDSPADDDQDDSDD
jgi:N utilization substance protein A